MPVNFSSNNRVLPSNVRNVDVAKATIIRAAQLQRLKQHAAISVQGFDVCVYNRLTSGTRCHCQQHGFAGPESVLYEDGKAPQGLINQLLTGGQQFDVTNYAATRLDNAPLPDTGIKPQGTPLFRIGYDDELPDDLYGDEIVVGQAGTSRDIYSKDLSENVSTYVESGVGANGVIQDSEFETLIDDADAADGGYGITDAACPVCMGTGFVGGYALLNGWRRVLNFQHTPADSPSADVHTDETVPPIVLPAAGSYTFTLVLPYGGVSVDALRVWNNTAQITTASVLVDDIKLTQPHDLLAYCNGRSHEVTVVAPDTGEFTFTHLELQVNQSLEAAYIDFPKIIRGNIRSELDNMQDVNVVVSPLVPLLRPEDYIADSVHQRVYQVTSVTLSSDNKLTVQGHEADCRVVTPQELQNLLPRRRRNPVSSPYAPSFPRDNSTGHRRV